MAPKLAALDLRECAARRNESASFSTRARRIVLTSSCESSTKVDSNSSRKAVPIVVRSRSIAAGSSTGVDGLSAANRL